MPSPARMPSSFTETMVLIHSGMRNLSELTKQLVQEHERELETLIRENAQMRRELKMAGAFSAAVAKTSSMMSNTGSNMAKTSSLMSTSSNYHKTSILSMNSNAFRVGMTGPVEKEVSDERETETLNVENAQTRREVKLAGPYSTTHGAYSSSSANACRVIMTGPENEVSHELDTMISNAENAQMRRESKRAGPNAKAYGPTSNAFSISGPGDTDESHDLASEGSKGSKGSKMSYPERSSIEAGMERLAEAKRLRSDQGRLVLQTRQFHGASGGVRRTIEKAASSQSIDTTTSPSVLYSDADVSSSAAFQNSSISPPATPPELPRPPEVPRTAKEDSSDEEKNEPRSFVVHDFEFAGATEDISSGDEGSRSRQSACLRQISDASSSFKLHVTWLEANEVDARKSARYSEMTLDGTFTNASSLRRSSLVMDLSTIHQENTLSRVLLKYLTLHPESSARITWDLTTLLIIAWDFITVPLQTFGDLYDEADLSSGVISLIGTIFWTSDIVVSLRTGIMQKDKVDMSARAIFLNYAKTWMLLDVCLIALDWIVVATGSVTSAAGSARLLKVLRAFRLLRLRKVVDFMGKMEAMSNSNVAILFLSIFKHAVILIMLNHVMACVWYAVGEGSGGWTSHAPMENSLAYRYFTSLHWSITQFHGTMEVVPTNKLERLVSVILLVFAMVGNAAFISAVTNKMLQAQHLVQSKTRIEQSFRSYLREHNVSLALSIRLKKAINSVRMDKQSREAEKELLSLIPDQLLTQLHLETRGPLIFGHSFFRRLHSEHNRCMTVIVHQAVQDVVFPSQTGVFHLGEVGRSMYFLASGEATYKFAQRGSLRYGSEREMRETRRVQPDDDRARSLARGERVSEPPLWVNWVHVGTLRTVTDASILELSAQEFLQVAQTSRPMQSDAAAYAKKFLSFLECEARMDLLTDFATAPEEWLTRSASSASSELSSASAADDIASAD